MTRLSSHIPRFTGARLAALFVMSSLLAGPATLFAQTETIEYYGTDAIGSIRIVWDVNGNMTARQDFTPFGEPVLQEGTALPKEGFVGNETDAETNQDYFHARMFEARTGRFTRTDPIEDGVADPQAWNRYAYASNNPETLSDSDGLMPIPFLPPLCKIIYCDPDPFPVTVDAPGDPGGAGGGNGGCDDSGKGCSTGSGNGNGNLGTLIPSSSITASTTITTIAPVKPVAPHLDQAPAGSFPWYHNSCITGALESGAGSAAIDLAGLAIPEGAVAARAVGNAVAGWRGAVAVRDGRTVIKMAKLGISMQSTAAGGADTSGLGMAATGLGVGGILTDATEIGEAIPGLSEAISVVALGVDVTRTGIDIYKCNQ